MSNLSNTSNAPSPAPRTSMTHPSSSTPLPEEPVAPNPARRWILGLLATILLAAFLVRAGQAFYGRLRPPEAVVPPPRKVQVLVATPQPFAFTVPVAGTLAPVHSVDVFPKVGGKVVKVFVRLGDPVKAGDPLATVESTEYGMQAEMARRGLAAADLGAQVARKSMERLDAVHQTLGTGALSTQDYESARAQAEGAVAQRDLAAIQADLASQMVRNATMTAPVSGRVSKVYARYGNMVGNEFPSFHIDDVSALQLDCQVGDLDLPRVQPGQSVLLWTDALPGATLQGTVTAVAPSLDAWTRRAPVEVSVPNPDGTVTGNLFARGKIIVEERADALVLPMEVVTRTTEGASVQVVEGGLVKVVPVTVLGESVDHVAVEGVAPGSSVVVPGADHLAEGERVDAVPVAPAPTGAPAPEPGE